MGHELWDTTRRLAAVTAERDDARAERDALAEALRDMVSAGFMYRIGRKKLRCLYCGAIHPNDGTQFIHVDPCAWVKALAALEGEGRA